MAKKSANKKSGDGLKGFANKVKDSKAFGVVKKVVGNTVSGQVAKTGYKVATNKGVQNVVKGVGNIAKNTYTNIKTAGKTARTSNAPGVKGFVKDVKNRVVTSKIGVPGASQMGVKTLVEGGLEVVSRIKDRFSRPKLIQETDTARDQFKKDGEKLRQEQERLNAMNQRKAGATTQSGATGGGTTTPQPTFGGQTQAGVPNTQTGQTAPVPGVNTTGVPQPGQTGGEGIGSYMPGGVSTTESTTTTTGGGAGDTFNSQFDLNSRIAEVKKESELRVRNAQSLLEQQKDMLDSSTNSMIDSINAKFEARITEMSDSNSRFYATAEKQGYRSGRSRYAPLVQAGILTGEEEAGIQRIAGLQSEQISLVQQAQSAHDAQSLQALSQYMNQIDGIHKDKMSAVNDMYNLSIRHENLALDKQRESRLAKEAQFDQSIKLADTIAPTFVDDISQFTNPDDKMAYVTSIADQYGIDPLILLAGIEESTKDDRIAQLELQKLQLAVNKAGRGGSDGEDGADGSASRRDQGQQYELKTIGTGRLKRANKFGLSEEDLQLYGKYLTEGGTPTDYKKAQIQAGKFTSGSKGSKFVSRIAKEVKNPS